MNEEMDTNMDMDQEMGQEQGWAHGNGHICNKKSLYQIPDYSTLELI
jgi:hypothetical protein